MPVTLGSNIASLQGQRQLSRTSDALSKTFERLASGQRINRASDDAAGLAIANSLQGSARLYNVANRNIQDGISMINILSSTLSNQKGIMFRLAELAEQSANGVYSDTQRSALNDEYQALIDEFGRLGAAAEFNGQNLLLSGRGSNAEEYLIQAGINGGLDSILQIVGADTGAFSGQMIFRADISGPGGDGIPDGAENINDLNYANNFQAGSPTLQEIADYSQNLFYRTEVTDSNGETREVIGVFLLGDFPVSDALTVSYFADDGSGETYENIGVISNRSLEDFANEETSVGLSFGNGATATLGVDLRGLSIVKDNDVNLDNVTSIDFTGVETSSRALAALEVVQNRISEISEIEGRFGALQSRLEAASNVVSTSRENALAAEGRIRDADIARESSELTRLSVLQQTASAVLAQANLQPALALDLLR